MRRARIQGQVRSEEDWILAWHVLSYVLRPTRGEGEEISRLLLDQNRATLEDVMNRCVGEKVIRGKDFVVHQHV